MKRKALGRALAGGLVVLAAALAAHGQTGPADSAPSPFPRKLVISDATVVVHAPQIESWQDYETVISWHAVQVALSDEETIHVGAVKIRAGTRVNKERRMVQVYQVEILDTHFPVVPEKKAARLGKAVTTAIAEADRGTYSLDLVLSYLAGGKAPVGSIPVKPAPPVIHSADSAASLVLLEGDAVFAPLEGLELQYALNTNWDLFLDPGAGTYYLLHWDRWLTAEALQGAWRLAEKLPAGFSRLPATDGWAEVRNALPWTASGQTAPQVFVSTRPAELILTDGPPTYMEIPGTMLAFVHNTESDVFLNLTSNLHYFLVAGRWFQAPKLQGPWQAAGPLPDDFAKIPRDSPRAHVLVAVPGTWEARLAVLEAGIPQKARVDPTKATLQVTYDGEPRFEAIPGTPLARGVNTPDAVIQAQQAYYACRQGVWFLSSSPAGPWAVATEIPDTVYTIPPASPAYPVTFVKIYGRGAGYVTFGFTAGYEQAYVSDEVVVYGTGDDHPPYLGGDGASPVYFPGFSPYGMAAYYEPYTGLYRRAAQTYGPYGGSGRGAIYEPDGTYARATTAWGSLRAATVVEAYFPPSPAAPTRTRSVYASWGLSVATPGHEWAAEQHRRAAPSSHTYVMAARKPGDADLYVGPDRNVYQPDEDGWNQVNSGGARADDARNEQGLQDDSADPDGWWWDVPPGGLVVDGEPWTEGAVVLNNNWRARRYSEARRLHYANRNVQGRVRARGRRR